MNNVKYDKLDILNRMFYLTNEIAVYGPPNLRSIQGRHGDAFRQAYRIWRTAQDEAIKALALAMLDSRA